MVGANLMQLLNLPITTAVGPSVTSTFQLRGSPGGVETSNMLLQATFTYGSGGTSADAYIQTSVSDGVDWVDVANFHFLLASARVLSVLTLSPATPVAPGYVPTDGTLAANTVKDGIIGSLWRVKFVTVGIYAGGTTLRVDAIANGLTVLP
jgi:hypothetical protein